MPATWESPRPPLALLVQGSHWQQNPELIRLFNAYRGTNIPETGIAPPDVLAQYGGPSGKKRKGSSPGEQATIELMKRAGVPAELAGQVAARIDANTGNAAPIPERLDSAYFLEMTEQKLAKFLRALDDQTIASMTGNDLVKAVSVFIEKRALLRGEPTQIVSHRDRQRIDEVIKMLWESAQKRGITLDLRPNPA